MLSIGWSDQKWVKSGSVRMLSSGQQPVVKGIHLCVMHYQHASPPCFKKKFLRKEYGLYSSGCWLLTSYGTGDGGSHMRTCSRRDRPVDSKFPNNLLLFCLIRSLPVLVSTPPLLYHSFVCFCHLHWKRHLHRCRNICFYYCNSFSASVIRYIKTKNGSP